MKKILFILLFITSTSSYAMPVLDLGLCLDSSGSVSVADFQLQLNGTAAAVENPAVMPQDGSVRVTVMQFGSAVSVEVAPTVITATSAGNVANTIRGILKSGGTTNMTDCISTMATTITGAVPATTRQVIDISTDGIPNNQVTTTAAAVAAQAAGVDALNALLVGAGTDPVFMGGLVFPQPDGGNDGFATVIPDFAAYEAAIASKIQLEVVPPPVDAIPTLSEWGLFILTFLLILISWTGIRRKQN